MELMQLQMFVAAAEEKSLQKAADRVRRTPQALSMAIAKLEDEIGVALFDRSTRRFGLSTAGEVFADYARRILSLLEESLKAVEEVSSVQAGRLRIGANQSIGEYLLPKLTMAFRHRYPGVSVKMIIGYSEPILSALLRGDVDLALVADLPRNKDVNARLIMKDRLVAIMSPDHPLAGHASIALEMLRNESLVLLTESSELRERVVEASRRLGIPLKVQVETETLDSIKRMVAHSSGIGIVPSLAMTPDDARHLVAKTIDEFPQDRSLWMVRPSNMSPACQAFIALLEAELPTVA
jgi:LysR family transcriptional activator of glutamate synthase operon